MGGIAIGVFLIVQAVAGFLETDATVEVDGRPHQVTVPTDGDRMLWVYETVTEPTCKIVDTANDTPVDLESPTGTYTRDAGKGFQAMGLYTFDPGSGQLEVTCGPAVQSVVEIGPTPEFGKIFGSLAAAIIIPILLGGGGFVLLIVIAILFATGRPRNVPAPG